MVVSNQNCRCLGKTFFHLNAGHASISMIVHDFGMFGELKNILLLLHRYSQISAVSSNTQLDHPLQKRSSGNWLYATKNGPCKLQQGLVYVGPKVSSANPNCWPQLSCSWFDNLKNSKHYMFDLDEQSWMKNPGREKTPFGEVKAPFGQVKAPFGRVKAPFQNCMFCILCKAMAGNAFALPTAL